MTEFYSLAAVLLNSLAILLAITEFYSLAAVLLILNCLAIIMLAILMRRNLVILILNSLAILLAGVLLILPCWRILLNSLAILSQQSAPTLLYSFFLAVLGLGLLIFNWRSGLAIFCGSSAMLMLLSHSAA